MTLAEAITAEIKRGVFDPHVIATRLVRRHGHAWAAKQLHGAILSLLADAARAAIRERRPVALAVIDELPGEAKALQPAPSFFHPSFGWKPVAALTAEDCDLLAENYRRLEAAAGARASVFERLAQALRDAGVATVGDLGVPVALEAA